MPRFRLKGSLGDRLSAESITGYQAGGGRFVRTPPKENTDGATALDRVGGAAKPRQPTGDVHSLAGTRELLLKLETPSHGGPPTSLKAREASVIRGGRQASYIRFQDQLREIQPDKDGIAAVFKAFRPCSGTLSRGTDNLKTLTWLGSEFAENLLGRIHANSRADGTGPEEKVSQWFAEEAMALLRDGHLTPDGFKVFMAGFALGMRGSAGKLLPPADGKSANNMPAQFAEAGRGEPAQAALRKAMGALAPNDKIKATVTAGEAGLDLAKQAGTLPALNKLLFDAGTGVKGKSVAEQRKPEPVPSKAGEPSGPVNTNAPKSSGEMLETPKQERKAHSEGAGKQPAVPASVDPRAESISAHLRTHQEGGERSHGDTQLVKLAAADLLGVNDLPPGEWRSSPRAQDFSAEANPAFDGVDFSEQPNSQDTVETKSTAASEPIPNPPQVMPPAEDLLGLNGLPPGEWRSSPRTQDFSAEANPAFDGVDFSEQPNLQGTVETKSSSAYEPIPTPPQAMPSAEDLQRADVNPTAASNQDIRDIGDLEQDPPAPQLPASDAHEGPHGAIRDPNAAHTNDQQTRDNQREGPIGQDLPDPNPDITNASLPGQGQVEDANAGLHGPADDFVDGNHLPQGNLDVDLANAEVPLEPLEANPNDNVVPLADIPPDLAERSLAADPFVVSEVPSTPDMRDRAIEGPAQPGKHLPEPTSEEEAARLDEAIHREQAALDTELAQITQTVRAHAEHQTLIERLKTLESEVEAREQLLSEQPVREGGLSEAVLVGTKPEQIQPEPPLPTVPNSPPTVAEVRAFNGDQESSSVQQTQPSTELTPPGEDQAPPTAGAQPADQPDTLGQEESLLHVEQGLTEPSPTFKLEAVPGTGLQALQNLETAAQELTDSVNGGSGDQAQAQPVPPFTPVTETHVTDSVDEPQPQDRLVDKELEVALDEEDPSLAAEEAAIDAALSEAANLQLLPGASSLPVKSPAHYQEPLIVRGGKNQRPITDGSDTPKGILKEGARQLSRRSISEPSPEPTSQPTSQPPDPSTLQKQPAAAKGPVQARTVPDSLLHAARDLAFELIDEKDIKLATLQQAVAKLMNHRTAVEAGLRNTLERVIGAPDRDAATRRGEWAQWRKITADIEPAMFHETFRPVGRDGSERLRVVSRLITLSEATRGPDANDNVAQFASQLLAYLDAHSTDRSDSLYRWRPQLLQARQAAETQKKSRASQGNLDHLLPTARELTDAATDRGLEFADGINTMRKPFTERAMRDALVALARSERQREEERLSKLVPPDAASRSALVARLDVLHAQAQQALFTSILKNLSASQRARDDFARDLLATRAYTLNARRDESDFIDQLYLALIGHATSEEQENADKGWSQALAKARRGAADPGRGAGSKDAGSTAGTQAPRDLKGQLTDGSEEDNFEASAVEAEETDEVEETDEADGEGEADEIPEAAPGIVEEQDMPQAPASSPPAVTRPVDLSTVVQSIRRKDQARVELATLLASAATGRRTLDWSGLLEELVRLMDLAGPQAATSSIAGHEPSATGVAPVSWEDVGRALGQRRQLQDAARKADFSPHTALLMASMESVSNAADRAACMKGLVGSVEDTRLPAFAVAIFTAAEMTRVREADPAAFRSLCEVLLERTESARLAANLPLDLQATLAAVQAVLRETIGASTPGEEADAGEPSVSEIHAARKALDLARDDLKSLLSAPAPYAAGTEWSEHLAAISGAMARIQEGLEAIPAELPDPDGGHPERPASWHDIGLNLRGKLILQADRSHVASDDVEQALSAAVERLTDAKALAECVSGLVADAHPENLRMIARKALLTAKAMSEEPHIAAFVSAVFQSLAAQLDAAAGSGVPAEAIQLRRDVIVDAIQKAQESTQSTSRAAGFFRIARDSFAPAGTKRPRDAKHA